MPYNILTPHPGPRASRSLVSLGQRQGFEGRRHVTIKCQGPWQRRWKVGCRNLPSEGGGWGVGAGNPVL